MKILGLTGSIAMGKSDTLRLFAEQGIPTFDSDHVVHILYGKGGDGVAEVERLCPEAVAEGAVDRQRLSAAIAREPALLDRLERAIHPLVRRELASFLGTERAKAAPLVVVDIPLLFETGREKEVDAVVVVSAPAEVQRQRVMARPGMTGKKFELLLARQLPDAEKRARADFIVDTGRGHDFARGQVREIVNQLLG
ncbi:MAG TPA: dephospho-CoA kinase [Aestuariivirgaceae bacterium]|jgi:dephospho-CoA kinase